VGIESVKCCVVFHRLGIKSEDVYGPNCSTEDGFPSSDNFPPPGGIMSPESMLESSASPSMRMSASGIGPPTPAFLVANAYWLCLTNS